MMLFKILINAIEAYIFPWFLSNYYSVEEKTRFTILYGTIQFVILNLCTVINQSGTLLTILIIGINYLSVFSLNKKISLNDLVIVLIYNYILLVSTYVSLLIVNNMTVSMNENIYYIVVCVISKLILIISTWYLLKYKIDFSIHLQKDRWSLTIVYELFLLVATVFLVMMLVTNTVNNNKLYTLLTALMILNVLYIFIIYKINNLNNENIKYVKERQLAVFNDEKLKLIKNIKNEIEGIDHRLFYVVFQIDNLLRHNETKKAEILLDNYKQLLLRQKKIIDTENSVFDILLSIKINDLIMNGVKVKTSIFITQKEYYNDFTFINYLVNLIDLFINSDSLQILISEKEGFLLVTMIYDEDIDLNRCKQYLGDTRTERNVSYNIDEKTQVLKLSFMMKGD